MRESVLLDLFKLIVKPVRTERIPPDPKGAAQGMQRIGYSLEEAIADLVDNSIDARASKILIRFFRNETSITQVAIVDNGKGMNESALHNAMQYGVQTKHTQADLGKYGIGLKTASFSQCQSLSVFSAGWMPSASGSLQQRPPIRRWRLLI
jgi:signal transduction histidine kinase